MAANRIWPKYIRPTPWQEPLPVGLPRELLDAVMLAGGAIHMDVLFQRHGPGWAAPAPVWAVSAAAALVAGGWLSLSADHLARITRKTRQAFGSPEE